MYTWSNNSVTLCRIGLRFFHVPNENGVPTKTEFFFLRSFDTNNYIMIYLFHTMYVFESKSKMK